MRNFQKFFLTSGGIIVCMLFFFAIPGLAQKSILATSNDAAGIGGSVSYSVGQVAFITYAGTGSSVTEGVQQPYEILFMEGMDPENGIALECLVYPNPATAFVNLKIKNREIKNLSCQMNDLNGLLLRNIKIDAEETVIPMEDLAASTYFLTVAENGLALQIYKIIKK